MVDMRQETDSLGVVEVRWRGRSRAAHFQGTPVPVTARLSGASGDPSRQVANVVAMATKFYLPDGTVTDLIGITLPAFFARTPEEFLAFAEAQIPDPATGQPDLARLKALVTLEEYGDDECPYCSAAYPVVKELQRRLGDRPCFVFRSFPITTAHPHTEHAAHPEPGADLGSEDLRTAVV
jgi:hypothetical protein